MANTAIRTDTSAPGLPTLGERNDIHKSCRSLEFVANAFNDYCRAADSLCSSKRRFSKALKEAAGMKCTSELAATSLLAVAGLLEVLAEVDSKFVRVVDKEYDSSISELKKWFKTLAREEKAHDETIAASSAKIKQAGLVYERKVNRRERDAVEEHTRYVNTLNTIGAKMSREKYNHVLLVAQNHSATLNSLVASILRIAEAAWQQSCEVVRKYSAVVGKVGECRAFLEGSWDGPIPDNLPACGAFGEKYNMRPKEVDLGGAEPAMQINNINTIHDNISSRSLTIPTAMRTAAMKNELSASSSNQQEMSPVCPVIKSTEPEEDKCSSVRSIETLYSFPTPPAHFPLLEMPLAKNVQKPEEPSLYPTQSLSNSISVSSSDPLVSSSMTKSRPSQTEDMKLPKSYHISQELSVSPSNSSRVVANLGMRDGEDKSSPLLQKDTFVSEPRIHSSSAGSVEVLLGRNESSLSSRSKVAALRDRWMRVDYTTLTTPKDVPRLSYSVSDLASFYNPLDQPLNTSGHYHLNHAARKVSLDANIPSSIQPDKQNIRPSSIPDTHNNATEATVHLSSAPDDRKRSQSPGSLGFSRKEAEQEELELDLLIRTREQERDRLELNSARMVGGINKGSLSADATGRMATPSPPTLRSRSQYSYSTTDLSSKAAQTRSQPLESFNSKFSTPLLGQVDHAPFCG